jgi:Zn-dependent peptidase ImmA (M78 family)/DNA-binding XRE family transcriptional regulator
MRWPPNTENQYRRGRFAMQEQALNNIDPKILGGRLQEARKARGLTQQAVAEEMDIARTTVVAIEKGERRVTPHELIKMAALYGRGVSDFVSRQFVVEAFAPQFRAALGVAESHESELEEASELQVLAENYVELERIFGMPMAKAYPPPYSDAGSSAEQVAEEIATNERNRLGIGDGPLGSLRDRLENDVGLRIFYFPMSPKIAGLFFYNDLLGGCVGINSKHPRDRRNWSLSHEYGHFLTSRYQVEVTLLREARRLSARERLADSFARFFLMPASGLNRRFSDIHRARDHGITLADILTLANIYQVSFQAMMLRLEELRRLPIGTWMRLSKQGFKVREAQQELGIEANAPVTDLLPQRYKTLAVLAYNKEKISEGQLAKMLRTDRVSARATVEEINDVINAEKGGEFPNLPLDLALTLDGR